MQDDGGTLARVVASAVLAALPFVWVLRHRGTRRDVAREGALDGWLLFFALVLGLFAFVMGGASLVRRAREARVAATWEPVPARLERCIVSERRRYGRGGGRVHELSCTVRVDSGGHAVARTVAAGYPGRRAQYVAWLTAHPAGSTVELRRDPDDPATLAGLDLVAPSTRTARAAANAALGLSAAAAVLFALSRLVVAGRRRTG